MFVFLAFLLNQNNHNIMTIVEIMTNQLTQTKQTNSDALLNQHMILVIIIN